MVRDRVRRVPVKARLGGTLYRDLGDKVEVIRIVRAVDESGRPVKFTAVSVEIEKHRPNELPHEAIKGREREVEEKIKNALRKRGYEVMG